MAWLGALLLLAMCGAASAGEQTATPPSTAGLSRFEQQAPQMGTMTRIVLYARDQATADRAIRAGLDRIDALNRVLSDYQDDSELMQLAARAGEGPVPVSADLFRVLEAAQSLSLRSAGAFDATSGPLTRLWRGARRLSELPDPARVERARALSGFTHLQLDARARTVTLDLPGMQLDVGGIAKGYAVDEALAAIRHAGVDRALVALGGDIAVSDAPPGEAGWRIEVAPLRASPDAKPPFALHLRHAAVSTAGDAEQWMDVEGRRYSHILDPRTGQPMIGRSSTTVVARTGLEADGLDTTAALLGPEAGARLVDAVPGAAMWMERETSRAQDERRGSARWPALADAVYDGTAIPLAHTGQQETVRSR